MKKENKQKSNKKYSLAELVKEKLIPGLTSYSSAYKLTTTKDDKLGRVPNKETTKNKLKAVNSGNSWTKISGKIYVEESEVKKFLELNNLL